MKLNIIFILIFSCLISFNSYAQVDESKAALLELENQLFHKKFSKKWDKLKKTEWEAKCNAATSIDELNVLFNEYSDLMAQLISFSMGNSEATNQLEFAEYLVKVNGTLIPDVLSEFDEEERDAWKKSLEEIIYTENYKIEKEKQLKKFLLLSKKLDHFKKNAADVIQYSKNTAFKTLKANSSFLKNGVSAGCTYRFEKNEAGKDVCIMSYNVDGDPLMAKKLVLELEEALATSVYPNHKSDVVITTLIDSDYSVEVAIVNGIKAN